MKEDRSEKSWRTRTLPPFIVAVVMGILLVAGAFVSLNEKEDRQGLPEEDEIQVQASEWKTEWGAGR